MFTRTQEVILRVLSSNGGTMSPTAIGNECRKHVAYSLLTASSAWACPKLKRLESLGHVAADDRRHYWITASGGAELDAADIADAYNAQREE